MDWLHLHSLFHRVVSVFFCLHPSRDHFLWRLRCQVPAADKKDEPLLAGNSCELQEVLQHPMEAYYDLDVELDVVDVVDVVDAVDVVDVLHALHGSGEFDPKYQVEDCVVLVAYLVAIRHMVVLVLAIAMMVCSVGCEVVVVHGAWWNSIQVKAGMERQRSLPVRMVAMAASNHDHRADEMEALRVSNASHAVVLFDRCLLMVGGCCLSVDL